MSHGVNNTKRVVIDTTVQGVALGLYGESSGCWRLLDEGYQAKVGASLPFLTTVMQRWLGGFEQSAGPEVVVGIGPGSFTGIKVGLAFVQGLRAGGLIQNCYAVSPLAAYVDMHKRPLLLRATRTGGYMGFYTDRGVTLAALELKADQVVCRLDSGAKPLQQILGGQRAQLLLPWPELEAALGQPLEVLGYEQEIAQTMLQAMLHVSQAMLPSQDLQPVYMRRSAPEEKQRAQT